MRGMAPGENRFHREIAKTNFYSEVAKVTKRRRRNRIVLVLDLETRC